MSASVLCQHFRKGFCIDIYADHGREEPTPGLSKFQKVNIFNFIDFFCLHENYQLYNLNFGFSGFKRRNYGSVRKAFLNKHLFFKKLFFKGSVSLISCKEGYTRFTMLTFKALSDQV